MAKKSMIERNLKRMRMASAAKNRRDRLKGEAMDKDATAEERFAAQMKMAAMPRNANKTRIRNRCELSGRPRGYYRKLKVSRIALRDLANSGQIPGMVKSSW